MPSAAILNGGGAVRFGGRDKGALQVDGRPIRDRQLEVLAGVADDVMLVAGLEPAPDTLVLTRRGARARWIADAHPGQGPLAGIEAGLLAARHGLVLVVACDMPGVTAEFLGQLLALAADVDIVVPRTERGYHPLCAVYRRETCLPIVSARLAEERLAVRAIFPALRLREVTGPELAATGDPRQLLANVNTPADHAALATHIAHEL